MTLTEKQEIAAAARRLIWLLQLCDDEVFVDTVLMCVEEADEQSLRPEYL